MAILFVKKAVERTVKEFTDAKAMFVSLVEAGANRNPYISKQANEQEFSLKAIPNYAPPNSPQAKYITDLVAIEFNVNASIDMISQVANVLQLDTSTFDITLTDENKTLLVSKHDLSYEHESSSVSTEDIKKFLQSNQASSVITRHKEDSVTELYGKRDKVVSIQQSKLRRIDHEILFQEDKNDVNSVVTALKVASVLKVTERDFPNLIKLEQSNNAESKLESKLENKLDAKIEDKLERVSSESVIESVSEESETVDMSIQELNTETKETSSEVAETIPEVPLEIAPEETVVEEVLTETTPETKEEIVTETTEVSEITPESSPESSATITPEVTVQENLKEIKSLVETSLESIAQSIKVLAEYVEFSKQAKADAKEVIASQSNVTDVKESSQESVEPVVVGSVVPSDAQELTKKNNVTQSNKVDIASMSDDEYIAYASKNFKIN